MIFPPTSFLNTQSGIIRQILFGTAMWLAVLNTTFSQGLTPAITVQPDTIAEVGEEIFFSATGTAYQANPALLRQARYEWDFGDGYTFKFGFPYYYTSCSGLACVHYFMRPGTFAVKLIVSMYTSFDGEGNPTSPPLAKDSAIRVMTVTGEAPMAGFELQHASFHTRLAQYLYAQIPTAHQGNQTTLRVSLLGPGGSITILFSKTGLAAEEIIILDQKPLAQDDYVVVAELLDAGNQRLPGGIWRDKFSKKYSGLPAVGLDENNSFWVNGKLFFPIMPYMTDNEDVQLFVDSAGINALHTEGWYAAHSSVTWTDYLARAAAKGLLCVGPSRGNYDYGELPPRRQEFNHDVDRIASYVQAGRNNPALLMWSWEDEPNLGGWPQKAYQPVLAAWQYVAHREDPNHPNYNGLAMYDWSKYYGTGLRLYDYLQSDKFFGGKKWIEDAIGGDIYPINYRLHPSLNFADMGPYAAYLDALDRIQTNNKNLVPCLPALQPCEETAGDNTPPPTGEQVYMEAWMNVIHGAKGILWFPYFIQSTMKWPAMKKFADQMKVLAPVVLGTETPRIVTDDANTPLNRVDVMIRESGTDVYLFCARVTEPDPISGAVYQGIEPESITVHFTVSGLSGSAVAEVVDENRALIVTDGRLTDTFSPNAVHIYRIDARISLVANGDLLLFFQVYPNPAHERIVIDLSPFTSGTLLTMHNILGQEVLRQELFENRKSIDVHSLSSGIYFLKVVNEVGTKVQKIVKVE